MATIPTTTYTAVKKVVDFIGLTNEIVAEAVGTGAGVETVFPLDNRKVVQGTDVVYVAGSAVTNYTLDYDTGTITFAAAPTGAITADYDYSDIYSSVIGSYINRAEDEIERRTGRKFVAATQTSEVYDGNASDASSYYTYQNTTALDDLQQFKTLDQAFYTDKTLSLKNYPVISVALVATDVTLDAHFDESAKDNAIAFGSTKWVSQSFKTATADPIVQVSLYMAYSAGTSAALTVGIYADNAGSPTGSALATATISAFTSTTYQFYDAIFTNPLTPTSGTTYHIVISSPSASGTSVFNLGVDATSPSYTDGQINTSANSGTAWTADAAKDAIFKEFVGKIIPFGDYMITKDIGRITFTRNSGDIMTKGVQNLLIVYSYGYSSVPIIVEQLATKIAGTYMIETRLMGDPGQNLDIKRQNIAIIQADIKRDFQSLGEKLELAIV